MKAIRGVLNYLKEMGVRKIFGIPAGSVNALFDELYEMSEITPIVTKHEGAAAYMAASYAKYSRQLSVCVGCSGPGSTNLVTGAANAMREHLPVLFLTGAVPVNTMGLNASQELDAAPIFAPVTKYSVRVERAKDLLPEVVKAVRIALDGVPGPVHIAIPIDLQHETVEPMDCPVPLIRKPILPEVTVLKEAVQKLAEEKNGYILAGQGVRNSVDQLIELAETLQWPIMTTPQAKGLIPDAHPLHAGVFGFAGHERASELINEGDGKTIFIVGSSLGETATNNYNQNLTKHRYTIQMDFDETVFNRKYRVDLPILSDIQIGLLYLNDELKQLGVSRPGRLKQKEVIVDGGMDEYNTQNVLLRLQKYLPPSTRYTVDIGEFMSYVIHHMPVLDHDTFDINVHFGAMGSGIGAAIGSKLAEPERPVVCITGDGCFFMHGMEILTAKEYNIPFILVVMNNARLGMVYHGHTLQFQRSHASFEQSPIDISALVSAMDIPSVRVEALDDLGEELMQELLKHKGPVVVEVALVDNNVPPMGDRVKFLSSFGK
ncbi:thiamine pyrophosphate-binding protein [Sporosarcina sp. HYO08]|uniref:thiamine pyrophosphate-binding protein n=1 Tax=Sporosarcina sp. HYO08 TaxID=1759557 RepID=UPI00079C7A73|nr:thiamine pyrophosphate-binding protein [Sporosarcina sp. HYO08]KXH80661.1 acetolactate synthase [Sporosarcina sp. HYO08]